MAIDGVRITLLTDVQGRTNLDLPPARCRTGAGAQGEARPLLALNRIDAVTVSHADLAASTRGRQTAPAFQVTGLGATIRPIDPGVSDWTKAVEIAANLRGTEVVTPLLTVPVQILLRRAPAPPRAGEGERSPLGLDTLRATGSVSIAGANPALTAFALSIPELDVNRLQRLMNPGQCEVASKPI